MDNYVNFWHRNEKRAYKNVLFDLGSIDCACEVETYFNKDFYVINGKLSSVGDNILETSYVYDNLTVYSTFESSYNQLVRRYIDVDYPSLATKIRFSSAKLSFQASYLSKFDDEVLTTKKFNQDFIFHDDYVKRPKLNLNTEGASAKLWQIVISVTEDSFIYGLGDLMTPLNKREYQFVLWNTDDPSVQLENRRSLYKSIPIVYIIDKASFEVWTVFFDNSSRAKIDLAQCYRDKIIYSVEDDGFSLYINHSRNIKEAYLKIVDLLGVNNLPKRSILGYQQSRWSYYSDLMLDELLAKFSDCQIPLSVINLDIDYMDEFKDFTYDKTKFKNLKSTAVYLSKKKIDLVLIIDAGLKYDPEYFAYSEAQKLDILLPGRSRLCLECDKDTRKSLNEYDYKLIAHLEEKLYLQDGNLDLTVLEKIKEYFYLGWVWPGHTVFPDFEQEKCRIWWKEKIRDFVSENNIAGIWLDMNEPANFNGDMPDELETLSRDKGRDCSLYHKNWHNRYANQMALATYEGLLEARPDNRPFVFSRAAYAGIQNFAGVWTGDSSSIWAQLRMQLCQILSLSLCGINLVSADIAGFIGNTNKELYIRWLELGIFYPFVRNHSEINSSYQEPWCFDDETLSISRDLIELRYSLLPYIYDAMIEAEVGNKLPLMRAMAMEYPEDQNCYTINDQFFFASALMIAPILDPGVRARAVYLPKGEWYNFHTNEYFNIETGRYLLVEAEYGKVIMFIKSGSILPFAKRENVDINSTDTDELIVKCYPSRLTTLGSELLSYKHYLDSGDGYAYRENTTTEYLFSWKNGEVIYQEKIGSEALSYKSIELIQI